MPGQRRDYILNQIDLLRQFVARLVSGNGDQGLDDMLQLSFSLQEKLFGMPPADFLQKDVASQVEILMRGESAESGREKCLSYARLLKETAALYAHRGRDDLADGARQLALHVVLTVGVQLSPNEQTDLLVNELSESLDLSSLHAPVLELLKHYNEL